MSDLIERLREEPYAYEKRHGLGITAMEVWHKTACEAADELEAKDAEIERLEKDNENLQYACGRTIERLRAFLERGGIDSSAVLAGEDDGTWQDENAKLERVRAAAAALVSQDGLPSAVQFVLLKEAVAACEDDEQERE
jgi:hypothetical protein